jgi:hypothetical protein
MGRRLPLAIRAGVVSCTVLGAALAHAQYRHPEPDRRPTTLEASVQQSSGPPSADTSAGGRTAGWDPLFVIESVFEENVGLTNPPGPDDFFGSVQASLTRWHRGTRNDFRLTLDGAGYVYREQDSRNRADGGVYGRFGSQLSRHVRCELSAKFGLYHTDTEGMLIDEAVLLPLVRTVAGNAGGALSWQVAERTTLSLSGGWQSIDFDSESLLDTVSWNVATSLSQRISQREALSLRLEGFRIEDERSTRHDARASLAYTYRFARNFALSLNAGAGGSEAVTGIETSPQRWDALLGAALFARLREGYVSVGYQHGLQPVPGLGVTELTDAATLSALVPVGRRLEVIVRGSFAVRGQSGDETPRRRRDGDAFAGAALRLARRLRIVLGYRVRYRENPFEEGTLRNDRASVSLAWGPVSLVQGR